MSARTPKYSCAPPGARRKPTKISSKMQHDAALGADLAQPVQPLRVGLAIEAGAPRAVDERGVGRGRDALGCMACEGLTSTQAMSRRVRSTRSDLSPTCRRACRCRRAGCGIADARLHVAPPAMIGAAEAHQARLAGVIAGEPHRLHHGLGAGHVEGDLVEARDLAQPAYVVGDHRMVRRRARDRDRATRAMPRSMHAL